MESVLYDAAGHRRSPATLPGFHQGRSPRNNGLRYPADPPTIEEIVAVMRAAGNSADGARLRALIVILWRAGLRIGEALDLAESSRLARCCASFTDRQQAAVGSSPPPANNCGGSRLQPGCVGGSRRISSAMPTPSRWHMKAFRWSSFSGSSVTPISASPRSICKGSTAQRSSTQSTRDRRR